MQSDIRYIDSDILFHRHFFRLHRHHDIIYLKIKEFRCHMSIHLTAGMRSKKSCCSCQSVHSKSDFRTHFNYLFEHDFTIDQTYIYRIDHHGADVISLLSREVIVIVQDKVRLYHIISNTVHMEHLVKVHVKVRSDGAPGKEMIFKFHSQFHS